MELLIEIAIAVSLVLVFVLSTTAICLCKASGEADRYIEEMDWVEIDIWND